MSKAPDLGFQPPVHDGSRVTLEAIVGLKLHDKLIVWIGGREVTLTNFEFNVATGGLKDGN